MKHLAMDSVARRSGMSTVLRKCYRMKKLLLDCHEQSDHVIENCRPDLFLVQKRTKVATIVNIAVPGDTNIVDREQDKILAHQDLKRKIERVWQPRRVNVIVVGALGTVTPKFQGYLDTVSYKLKVSNIQKTGSAHILRKVLEIFFDSLHGDRSFIQ